MKTKCVYCGKDVYCPQNLSEGMNPLHYVESAGQLCPECYHDIYLKPNNMNNTNTINATQLATQNLSLMQEQQLHSLRGEMEGIIKQRTSQSLKLLMFTFYPRTEKLGASVITSTKKIYYGRGTTMSEVADEIAKAISRDEYILQSQVVTLDSVN